MDSKPGFSIDVPAVRNGMVIQTRLSADKALEYTPLTTSMLPPHSRIPLPQITRSDTQKPLVSKEERKRLENGLLRTADASAVQDRLINLLNGKLLQK